eukprot:Skav213997  [mRNA]  locus=scaffold941:48753:52828:+ [translate_table: standard]
MHPAAFAGLCPVRLARAPVQEIENGEFRGKTLEVPEVEALAMEWNLTHEAKVRLNEMVSNRGTKKGTTMAAVCMQKVRGRGQDVVRLEKILEHTQNKSETVVNRAGASCHHERSMQ